MQQTVRDFLEGREWTGSTVYLEMVIEELLVNSVTHGKATLLEMTLALQKERLCLTWTDDGVEFDPNKAAPKEQEVGGQGLNLIRRMFPKIDYRRSEEKNVWVMTAESQSRP